jgi:hypothetical protein
MPKSLEYKLIKYVHTSMGHSGTDKCISQTSETFYVKNLGRKVRKYVAQCDICQRVKHPGDLLTTDLYRPLPTGRGGVKHLLVCLDMFTKHTH